MTSVFRPFGFPKDAGTSLKWQSEIKLTITGWLPWLSRPSTLLLLLLLLIARDNWRLIYICQMNANVSACRERCLAFSATFHPYDGIVRPNAYKPCKLNCHGYERIVNLAATMTLQWALKTWQAALRILCSDYSCFSLCMPNSIISCQMNAQLYPKRHSTTTKTKLIRDEIN